LLHTLHTDCCSEDYDEFLREQDHNLVSLSQSVHVHVPVTKVNKSTNDIIKSNIISVATLDRVTREGTRYFFDVSQVLVNRLSHFVDPIEFFDVRRGRQMINSLSC
jgi:hypothetical protein